MTKDQQDRLWAGLSKEERKRHRDGYRAEVKALSYNSGFNDALESIFGKHNLTSDTEPRELLFVDKKKVGDLLQWANECTDDTEEAYIVKNTIECLFGDKCLPDKELNEENFVKSEPSVQVEPKFKVGDRIMVNEEPYVGEIGTIIDYDIAYQYEVKLDDSTQDWVTEYDLEPYTEPETKDAMEEKELNLCELLKDCEGEKFYSRCYGEVTLERCWPDLIKVVLTEFDEEQGLEGSELLYNPNGKKTRTAEIDLFPSKEQRSWIEWGKTRKPKRWRAERDDEYWLIDNDGVTCTSHERFDYHSNRNYRLGNYFRTSEEAYNATKVIKKALMEFHKKNCKQ